MPLRKNPLWLTVVLAAAGILAVHIVGIWSIHSPMPRLVFNDLSSPIVDFLAFGGILWAAWRLKSTSPEMARAWAVIGLAQFFTLAADILWLVYDLWLGGVPDVSVADLFYLLFYPTFLIGVLLLPTHKAKRFEWYKLAVDMIIVLLSAVLVLWNYLIGPLAQQNAGQPFLFVLITMAYPVSDLILLAALMMILNRPGGVKQNFALWLLACGVLVTITFDLIFGSQNLQGTYVNGSLTDTVYLFGNLLLGLGGVAQALQYRQRQEVIRSPAGHPEWQGYMPFLWVLGAYFLLVIRNINVLPMSMMQISLFVGLIIALVIFRQILAIRENYGLQVGLRLAFDQVQSQAEALEKANREMQAEIVERKRVESRLSYDALHDALTGLPNRALFLERLTLSAHKKQRSPAFQYAVLFLDLDSFKVVNDSLGHVTGDHLLIRTAEILQNSLRSTDMVARLGGDEFVILLDDIQEPEDVLTTASRLQCALSQPMQLATTQVFLSVSIGIVQHVDDYEYPEDILRDADLAMYQAKSHGKARYEIFHEDMRANAISRMILENDMRRGLERGEFLLHYQPILQLPERNLVGFEALVRWQHPQRGLVGPMDFIPVAEETGLIIPLGKWILYEACKQAVAWRTDYLDLQVVKVNVNISGKQLKQPDFVSLVDMVLQDTGLPAACLALEVTESVCLDNLESVAKTLQALHDLGVEAQIDDFGTGYSSLSYLQRLPVESIKIDRSFIHAIANSEGSAPDIVRAIFSMVNNLGIKAVAEGIENEAQLEVLSRLRCTYVQGFLLATPMDHFNIECALAGNPQFPVWQQKVSISN